MPPNDIGFDNLSRTGVDHRRSHGIRLLRGRISNHRITRIVDIEIRIIGRSILRYNRIFKTGSFKSFLPIKNTGFNLLPPLSRSCRVDIKYNRFGRFYQLAPVCISLYPPVSVPAASDVQNHGFPPPVVCH